MFKTSDTFATFVASPLLADGEFRQLCKWLVTREEGELTTPAVKLAARVIADDESRQREFHDLKKQQAKARKEKAENAENSTKAENAENGVSIPFRSRPFPSVPIQSKRINTVPVSVSVQTETETETVKIPCLNEEIFFDGTYDPVILARAVTRDNKRLSCRTWRKEIERIGEDKFREELFTFWREIKSGEDCDNRGAAFTVRIKARGAK